MRGFFYRAAKARVECNERLGVRKNGERQQSKKSAQSFPTFNVESLRTSRTHLLESILIVQLPDLASLSKRPFKTTISTLPRPRRSAIATATSHGSNPLLATEWQENPRVRRRYRMESYINQIMPTPACHITSALIRIFIDLDYISNVALSEMTSWLVPCEP